MNPAEWINPEERMNSEERLVVEGDVAIGGVGEPEEKVVTVWNPRIDKTANLADYIEAALGSEENVGFYGPMRITKERMPL